MQPQTQAAETNPGAQVHADLMYLCGTLLHRGAQTMQERRAAEYLKDRLLNYTPHVALQDFRSFESPLGLFASYLGEYILVALLALWWPGFALLYGTGIFIAFLAEFMGTRVFSRFLPEFESQNVIAQFKTASPKRHIIIHAYYDSGAANPLLSPQYLRWLRPAFLLIIAAIVLILATCAVDALDTGPAGLPALTTTLRWSAAIVLAVVAIACFICAGLSEDVRGANNNASGVAAALAIAQELRQHPIPESEVWILLTGAHEAWMSGMRHFLDNAPHVARDTYLLNLEAVGVGTLHYITVEGMLHPVRATHMLRFAAAHTARNHGITPAAFRRLPTALHIPLYRGWQGMSIMALDQCGLPHAWNSVEDKLAYLDEEQILTAARFTVALLRQLATGVA